MKPNGCVPLGLVPVTLTEARRFIAEHHRHNGPPIAWRFGVGIADEDGCLVGVAMAGLPKSRMAMAGDPYLLEVNRTCTLGTPNANSLLYGAVARAAKALGYRRLVTFTLPEESGASLRASGWVHDGLTGDPADRWERANGQHATLFGPNKRPGGPKQRWRREL